MENPLITVIVPVYNVEIYLNRCVNSIIEQNYKNLEVILVDDGSTDESGAICDEYSQRDPRITVIHKENGGLSSAKNAGLDIMTGEYVTFVDSDDYVSSDYVDYLYTMILKYKADMSICQLKRVFNYITALEIRKEQLECFDGVTAAKHYLYQRKFTASSHCKMYKAWLFDGIRYPVGYYYEDMAVICQLLLKTSTVIVSNQQKYYYLQRTDSIMSENFNNKKLHRKEIAQDILKNVKDTYPDLINAAQSRCFLAAVQTYREVPHKSEYKVISDQLWDDIKHYRKQVIADKESRPLHKIIALLSYCGGKTCFYKFGEIYTMHYYKSSN
ncbi:glycosyltransferase family 2 protein [Butyrivibrio fibrisolvens]|uniref:glycosyltransferase family 2 protein n=1 Tax=Butyrivibrio fibrisolvens TaxID=831 RepID=UPI00068445C7|nr:glycosyltransferase family 2 protein [Butyrivibrio fibrisolvens]